MPQRKNILILGSTGNLGKQASGVLKDLVEYHVAGLTTNSNTRELRRQIKDFNPNFVVIADKRATLRIKTKTCRIYSGQNYLSEVMKKEKVDCVFNCLSGTVGIAPTLVAIRAKKEILMANKESLVAAGEIIMKEAKKRKVKIFPIDSEHSAIFQCLAGEKIEEVDKIILTCSGGYRGYKKNPKIGDLLKKSKWKMGNKITVDSATLMNKGLEVIEAQLLFDLPAKKIGVVIHPEAIVHSMVQFKDGNIKVQLGPTDMKIPILYALTYPRRKENQIKKLQFNNLTLHFRKPNLKKFPCLYYAYQAAETGGTAPAALVAANDMAVEYYLKNKINLEDIPKIIKKIIGEHKNTTKPNLDKILSIIEETKNKTRKLIEADYL